MQVQDADPTQSPTWELYAEFSLPYSPDFSDAPYFLMLLKEVQLLGLCPRQTEQLRGEVIRSIHHVNCRFPLVPIAPVILVRLFVAKRKTNHGWGYFLVERLFEPNQDKLSGGAFIIELYFYQEGGEE